MHDTKVKTRGSVKPDLQVTIGDETGTADFSTLTPAKVFVVGEMNGVVIFDSPANEVVPAQDGKSAIIRRAWAPAEVEDVGHLWIQVRVEWTASAPQWFPSTAPLRVDIVRAPGDA